MIISENSSSNFEPIEEGLYPAVCVSIAGIGMQETPFGEKNKLILTFELPTLRREWEIDGEKHAGNAKISNTYTVSLNEKAILRQTLEGWRGRAFSKEELAGFDLDNVLGQPCQVLIKHTHKENKTYANISDIIKFPKGQQIPQHESQLVTYDPSNHDPLAFDLLPDWIASKVNCEAACNPNPPQNEVAGAPMTQHQQREQAMSQPVNEPQILNDDDIPF